MRTRTGGRRGSSKLASPVENEAAADPADPTKTGAAAETAAVVVTTAAETVAVVTPATKAARPGAEATAVTTAKAAPVVTTATEATAVMTTAARAEAAAVMTTLAVTSTVPSTVDGDKHGGGGGGGWDKHGGDGGWEQSKPATHRHDREDNSRGYSLVSSRGSGSRGRKGGNKSQKGHGRRSREGKKAWWDAKAAEEVEEEVFGPFGQIPAFKVSELERNRKGRVTCPVCAVQVHPDGLGLHLLRNSGSQSKQLEIETGQKRDRTFTCKKCNWTEWDLGQHAGRCSWAVADVQEPVGPRPEVRLRSRSRRSPPARADRNDYPAADSAEPPTRLRVYAELGKNLLR